MLSTKSSNLTKKKLDTQQTNAIPDGVSEIDWSVLGTNVQMFLVRILIHLNQPLVLTAGRIIPLSLNTFIQVCCIHYRFRVTIFSYSYFIILMLIYDIYI